MGSVCRRKTIINGKSKFLLFSLERGLTAAELVLPGVEPHSISQGLLGALDLGLQRGGRAGLGGEPAFSAQFMFFSACL